MSKTTTGVGHVFIPLPSLLLDVGRLPGDEGHLLGEADDMLPGSGSQLQGEELPVRLLLQCLLKQRAHFLPVPLRLRRQQHGMREG